MSQQGIRGFYQLTETIKDQLLADINCNTVTTGDLYDVNLNKQDIFPLAHIIVNNVTQEEQTLTFNISILAMDIVAMQDHIGDIIDREKERFEAHELTN